MKTKYVLGQITKAADAETDGSFVLSTSNADRVGDKINVDGWDLVNFSKNPIALWQHDHEKPIGTWTNVRKETDRLVGDLNLGTTNLAQMARQLIEDGILKAVSVGFIPKDMKARLGEDEEFLGYDISEAELLEASLVSVPMHQDALRIAKGFGLSDDELKVVFDRRSGPKSVDTELMCRAENLTGKSADKPTNQKVNKMKLSERIVSTRTELVELKDSLADAADAYADDPSEENATVVEGFADKVQELEKQLDTLETAEKRITPAISGKSSIPQAPAIVKGVKDYEPGELFIKQAVCKWLSYETHTPYEEVRKARYAGDKGLEVISKAATAPGDTTTTAWAESLLSEQVASFFDLFANNSVYGALRGSGLSLDFSGAGTIKIPSRTSTSTAPGAFVGEGAPIPVKELSFTSQTLTRHKMGVIVTMTEELMDATNSQIEAIVRQAILDDTAKTLDSILMDATAGDAIRPAGLLNGVTPTASAGATAANIITDIKALISPFTTDDAGRNIVIAIHPTRRLGLLTVQNAVGEYQFADEVRAGSLFGYRLIDSANVATDEVHAINAGEFATAWDAPTFLESNTATLHMEDTTPAEIVSGVPVTANPVRSLFQTYTRGLRMILPVTWTMRRSGEVSSLSGVAW